MTRQRLTADHSGGHQKWAPAATFAFDVVKVMVVGPGGELELSPPVGGVTPPPPPPPTPPPPPPHPNPKLSKQSATAPNAKRECFARREPISGYSISLTPQQVSLNGSAASEDCLLIGKMSPAKPSPIRENYRETRQNTGGRALTPNALKVSQN